MSGIPKDFHKVEKRTITRLTVAVDGFEKTGKSSLAFSAPGDIALFNTDRNVDGVADNFADAKNIYEFDYRAMPVDTETQWTARWAKYVADYYRVLEADNVRTIVCDTSTEAWEMLQLARHQGKPVIPTAWAPVNAEFRRMIDAAKNSGKNLVLIHRLKKTYVGPDPEKGKPKITDQWWNGKWERAGFKETAAIAQVNLRTFVDEENQFKVRVVSCGVNSAVNGRVFEGDEVDFAYIAAEITGTDMEEWM